MDFDIIKITNRTKKWIVLGFQGKVINPEKPLWEKGPDENLNNGIVFPAAFLLNKLVDPPELEVEVTIRSNGQSNNTFELTCLYEKKIVLFSGQTDVSKEAQKNAVFVVKAQIEPGGFSRIPGEKLYWQIKCINTTEVSEFRSVNLELYWIYGDCYEIFRRGIPVEILRELARACWISGQIFSIHPTDIVGNFNNLEGSIKQWIIEAVVNYCFFRNPPYYNIKNKGSRFIEKSITTDKTMIVSLKLKQYLNPCDEVCNCLDQAAILFYYLGCTGITRISFYIINHFGYLKYTRLIGRGYCNNPIEGMLVVDERNTERKGFTYHICCYLNDLDWILDSCIGPHIGGENYDQYRENVIDKIIPEHSQPLESPQEKKHDVIIYTDAIPKPIKIPKSQSILIENFFKVEGLSENALNCMRKNIKISISPNPIEWEPLEKEGGWSLFFEDLIPGYEKIIKTWKLKKDDGRLNIDLHVFNLPNTTEHTISNFLYTYLTAPSEDSFQIVSDEKSGIYSIYFPEQNTYDYFFLGYANYIVMIQPQDVDKNFLDKLSSWFRQKFRETETIVKTPVIDYLSLLDEITISRTQLKIGEKVKVEMPCRDNILYDFIFVLEKPKSGEPVDIGLRLIDEGTQDGRQFFEFEAVKPAVNKLIIAAVDKGTLLVRKKEFTIRVVDGNNPKKPAKKGGKQRRQTKNK